LAWRWGYDARKLNGLASFGQETQFIRPIFDPPVSRCRSSGFLNRTLGLPPFFAGRASLDCLASHAYARRFPVSEFDARGFQCRLNSC
jgi:hypothetical protein